MHFSIRIKTSILLCCSVLLGLVVKAGAQNSNCIEIDETAMQISPAGCNNPNGSITGIKVTGATTYVWRDDFGNIVSTSKDLVNAAAGSYQLTASNPAQGCQKSGSLVFVPSSTAQLPLYNVYGINTACDVANGSLHIEIKDLPMPKSIRWVNEADATIGNQPDVYGLDVGAYRLYLKGDDGCEVLYKTAVLSRTPLIGVDFLSAKVTSDVCNQGLGSITDIQISNGLGPFTFKWTDATKNVVSTTKDLQNAKEGTYTLAISDACGKGDIIHSYTIANNDISVLAPTFNDVKLCSPSTVAINPVAPKAGIYRYYDSDLAITPIYQSTAPSFQVKVDQNRSFYISYGFGSCESPRTKVNVEIGIAANNIPNTISPNGDHINDFWNLSWLVYYKNAEVKIYNRLGQLVYNYQRDGVMFSGTSNGKTLPSGTYFYLIRLGADCKQFSGSLTLIR